MVSQWEVSKITKFLVGDLNSSKKNETVLYLHETMQKPDWNGAETSV